MAGFAEYIEEVGVVDTLQKALGSLVENRPKKPLEFLLSRIENNVVALEEDDKDEIIQKAVNLLSLTDPFLPVFEDNLAEAYVILASKYDNSGVSPEDFNEVLFSLCSSLPAYVNVLLLPMVERCGNYFVSFNDFVSGVNPCIVMREYGRELDNQFYQLCTDKSIYNQAPLENVLNFIKSESWGFPSSCRRREVDTRIEDDIEKYIENLNIKKPNHYVEVPPPPKSPDNMFLQLDAEKEFKRSATSNTNVSVPQVPAFYSVLFCAAALFMNFSNVLLGLSAVAVMYELYYSLR